MPAAWESLTSDSVTSDSDTTLLLAVPSGTADGDLLLAVIAKNTGRTFTAPSGWTELAMGDAYWQVFYKVASSESGSYEFTASSTYTSAHGTIHRISGGDTPSVSGAAQDSTWDATMTCGEVSVSVAGSLILWCGMGMANTATTTCTSDKGSERYDSCGGSYDYPLHIYSESIAGTGTQGGATLTISDVTNNKRWMAILIPAASSAAPSEEWLAVSGSGAAASSGSEEKWVAF